MPTLTPQQFSDKWERSDLKERASYQEHFMDVCRLVDHPTPAEKDPAGEFFTFEAGVKTATGGQGYADVWYRDHFAIEYKGKGKYPDLDAAYQQLQRYRENLGNPPLLVVCDIEHWEIHTNFTGTEKVVHHFTNRDIATSTRVQRLLNFMFFEPNALHPARTSRQVTENAADVFRQIAENMRDWHAAPERIARFLTKLVFCLFAEDVDLLPTVDTGRGIFTEIVAKSRQRPTIFTHYLRELFQAMQNGGEMLFRDIAFFDGGLFDNVDVEELSLEALTALEQACNLDWSSVQPGIFGTLFERSLDPDKRAQLGAHYTSEDDIRLIVEPVLMAPLRSEWEAIQAEAAPIRAAYAEAVAEKNKRKQQNRLGELAALRDRMLECLRSVTVLDPACGSGNFLYVALQSLLDLEKQVRLHPLFADLPLAFPGVHPSQLYGIEINPIAHDLASIVVWIGYIQWWRNSGERYHNVPILEPLDNIRQMDAILAFDADGSPVEPAWPSVDVIVSNPPFLGDKRMRAELGDHYVDQLRSLYEDRIPGQSDLVCYWFEQSRQMIEQGKVKRAGLLATNSIRGGANRAVLERIKETGDIFMAWSDRPWILEGAAVRVSMVGFDNGDDRKKKLDGVSVNAINSDLTALTDVTNAIRLEENGNISFIGTQKNGDFDIPEETALKMLREINPAGCSNRDVVKPWVNGMDIVRRSRNMWIIDFGVDMPIDIAALYEAPFNYVQEHVMLFRSKNPRQNYREMWWIHAEPRPGLRRAIKDLGRFIVTPTVATHRIFAWLDREILPDKQLVVFARSDDYFFGVLHSRIHERWALRMGTWLGKGNDPRYTPTTTFGTFPFPWPPSQEPTDHPAYRAISDAARQLHAERDAWLNPPGLPESALKQRTLTNLYNALQVFRGEDSGRVVPAAGDFAPRLDVLHRALDEAVCDAYGWEYDVLADEEELLRRLLALNLERAAQQGDG